MAPSHEDVLKAIRIMQAELNQNADAIAKILDEWIEEKGDA